ncbi:MAG: hypothetical protein ACTSRS_01485 [Candidatus Helarchaeota archaeon]
MPKGIILIGWTNKEGFFLIHKYPESVQISDDEIMRIGSAHRMRNLDANTITLREKELNVASFFSGLITSKYLIAPNFVISLLLEKNENARDYLKTLPKGAEIILSEFPVKRFDARTTSFKDVLSNIGESYRTTLPKLYDALINQKIQVKQEMDDFFDSLARDLESPETEENLEEVEIESLKSKIKEQEGVIKMLQNMLKEQNITGGATEYIAKIETMKTKISNLEQRIREKDQKISELEIQLSRISLLETRIQSLQAEITERDAELVNLRSRLTSASGLLGEESGGTMASTGEVEVWKSKVRELQRELQERNLLLNKMKMQLTGRFDESESRELLAELSGKTLEQSPFDEDLEDEMKSKYITL